MLEFLIAFAFKILFCWIGEIILCAVTLGKHRPRWDSYTSESASRFVIFPRLEHGSELLFGF